MSLPIQSKNNELTSLSFEEKDKKYKEIQKFLDSITKSFGQIEIEVGVTKLYGIKLETT